jgi:hypothetical protein
MNQCQNLAARSRNPRPQFCHATRASLMPYIWQEAALSGLIHLIMPVACRNMPGLGAAAMHRGARKDMMIGRAPSPVLPDLRPALQLAGPARPLGGVQGRGVARPARHEIAGRAAAPYHARDCTVWRSGRFRHGPTRREPQQPGDQARGSGQRRLRQFHHLIVAPLPSQHFRAGHSPALRAAPMFAASHRLTVSGDLWDTGREPWKR